MSTPVTRAKCCASPRVRRPAPQPKSSALVLARRGSCCRARSTSAPASATPVEKNSSMVHLFPSLPESVRTAQNGSAFASSSQWRCTCQSFMGWDRIRVRGRRTARLGSSVEFRPSLAPPLQVYLEAPHAEAQPARVVAARIRRAAVALEKDDGVAWREIHLPQRDPDRLPGRQEPAPEDLAALDDYGLALVDRAQPEPDACYQGEGLGVADRHGRVAFAPPPELPP